MEPETKILLRAASRAFFIPEHKVFSNTKKEEVKEARQMVQYFLKEYTDFSLAKIGNETGGKNHATILHSHKVIQGFIDLKDRRITEAYEDVKESINHLIINGKIRKLYVVESNIPLPDSKVNGKKYPFDTLKPGDSFCAWPTYEYRILRNMQHASYKFAKKYNTKYMVRKYFNPETVRDEIRVWRIK